MIKRKRRTAAEIIAFHIGYDFAEMKDCRYQSTRFIRPAIYVCGNDYYAAPVGSMPEGYAGLNWRLAAREYERDIYRADGTETA